MADPAKSLAERLRGASCPAMSGLLQEAADAIEVLQKANAAAHGPWDDRADQWTPQIEASHPMRTGAHAQYATALEMVGHRRSKGELVELVCWLLQTQAPRTTNAPETPGPLCAGKAEPQVLAWLIEWYDGRGRGVYLHNAIADFRELDPAARSTALVAHQGGQATRERSCYYCGSTSAGPCGSDAEAEACELPRSTAQAAKGPAQ